jgi:hypothetical protein
MKKTVVILGIGCGVIAVAAIVALGVVVGPHLARFVRGPQDVVITADLPGEVAQGSELTLSITVKNTAAKAQLIDSVDVSKRFVEELAIRSSEPEWRFAFSVFDDKSYQYEIEVPPGEEKTIRFHGQPASAGTFAGEVDVCIGNGATCSSLPLKTTVKAAG